MATSWPQVEIRASDLTRGGTLNSGDMKLVLALLGDGGLVVVPSDTCYALSAPPKDQRFAKTINVILNRREEPISLAFDTIQMASGWAELNRDAIRLLEIFSPGPITVVARAADHIPGKMIESSLTAPEGTLGIRVPDSQIERQISSGMQFPITTAAIRYSDQEPVRDFDDALEIVRAGLSRLSTHPPSIAAIEARMPFHSRHSTVVVVPATDGAAYSVKREGAIPTSEIDRVIGRQPPQEWS